MDGIKIKKFHFLFLYGLPSRSLSHQSYPPPPICIVSYQRRPVPLLYILFSHDV